MLPSGFLIFLQCCALSHFRRGISNFYSGKSKSFTSLADASSATSIKDIEKVENPYTRKRKNLLAHGNFLDKNHNYPLKNNGGGISKRPTNSSRSTIPIGVTMTSSVSNNRSEDSNSVSTSPSFCLPPLHPHGKTPPSSSSSPPPPRRNSPWRSFSLSDLQFVAAATPNISSLAICSRDEENKLHWQACVSSHAEFESWKHVCCVNSLQAVSLINMEILPIVLAAKGSCPAF